MTTAEIEAQAHLDALLLRESVILISEVDGMACNQGVVRRCLVHPPVRARVILENSSVIRWTTGGWCDPLYEVELLESRPDLADLTVLWVYGTSYDLAGNTVRASFAVEDAVPSDAANPAASPDPQLSAEVEDSRAAAARRPYPES